MKLSGLTKNQWLDVYKKEVRSLLELAIPVWSSNLTVEHIDKIERVQKSALSPILGVNYESDDKALTKTNMDRLLIRREKICLIFIKYLYGPTLAVGLSQPESGLI